VDEKQLWRAESMAHELKSFPIISEGEQCNTSVLRAVVFLCVHQSCNFKAG